MHKNTFHEDWTQTELCMFSLHDIHDNKIQKQFVQWILLAVCIRLMWFWQSVVYSLSNSLYSSSELCLQQTVNEKLLSKWKNFNVFNAALDSSGPTCMSTQYNVFLLGFLLMFMLRKVTRKNHPPTAPHRPLTTYVTVWFETNDDCLCKLWANLGELSAAASTVWPKTWCPPAESNSLQADRKTIS